MNVRRVNTGRLTVSIAESAPEVGAGRPLLLVHGFTGAKEDFAELFAPLAATGWHAVAPDLRGHGDSDKPAGAASYDLEAFEADVLALADTLDWPEFVLLGHSMGGTVAQRIALHAPERVRALVLMSTFHGPLEIDPALVALGVMIVDQGGMPALAGALAARRSDDPAAVAARARMEAVRPGHAEWADAKLLSCSPDMWRALAPRFPAWPDTLPELPAVTAPTLVVVGSEDEAMLPQCRQIAAAIPGAQLVVLDGLRHSPQLESPDQTWAALAPFLASVRD